MRIKIPIHLAFLVNNNEITTSDGYEKATNKLSKKKMEQYDKILKLMDDGNWHKTAEIKGLPIIHTISMAFILQPDQMNSLFLCLHQHMVHG